MIFLIKNILKLQVNEQICPLPSLILGMTDFIGHRLRKTLTEGLRHQTRQWQHAQQLPGQDLPCCLCYCPKAQPQGGGNGAAESKTFT